MVGLLDKSKNHKYFYLFLLLGVYFMGVAFTFFVLSRTAYGPVHQGDEDRYWNMAYEMYKGIFSLKNNYNQPPLYPLFILPAFIFYPHGAYSAVKLLNAIYFTSVIFPSYFLLRKFLSKNLNLCICAAILFNPAQIVIPRLVLSENIFFPLLMWTLYFSFTNIFKAESKNKIIENIIFGILLGSLVLSRYIAIAVIPAFLIVWWLKPGENQKVLIHFSINKFIQLLQVILPLALIIVVWVNIGIQQGLTIKQVLGFSIAADSDPFQLTGYRLLMWTVFYLSYFVLISAPVLSILLFGLVNIRRGNQSIEEQRLVLSLILIAASFLIACIRHSWSSGYNYPEPLKVQGRYVLYFGPLFLITAFILIQKIKSLGKIVKVKTVVIIHLISLGLIFVSYEILYEGLFFLGRPLQISISSPDAYFIESTNEIQLVFFAFFSIISFVFILNNSRKVTAIFFLVYLLVFFWGDFRMFFNKILPQQFYPVQAYHLTRAIENSNPMYSENIPISIGIEPGNSDDSIEGRWLSTLYAYGYRNVTFIEDRRLSGEAQAYNFVKVGADEYRIDGMEKQDFIKCQCEKYELLGKYYTIQLNRK
ncbi:MAG: ArnT family glycosyltransferase [Anaerolineaceae bacterium]